MQHAKSAGKNLWRRNNPRRKAPSDFDCCQACEGRWCCEYERDADYGSLWLRKTMRMSRSDWARPRILDGYWFSPADTWYQCSAPGQPAVVAAMHPYPCTREYSSSNASSRSALPTTDEVEEMKEELPRDLLSPPKFRHSTRPANNPTPPTSGKCV